MSSGLIEKFEKAFYILYGAGSACVVALFLSRRSPEPWIFGRYSLALAAGFIVAVGGLIYAALLMYKFRRKAIAAMGLLCAAGVAGLLMLEIGGHIYAFSRPGYRVLFLAPDRVLGWRIVPEFEWTWTGHYWYWRDFSEKIKANSFGFRDFERKTAKPDGVRRVALLGDSLVEALQVPIEKTAAQVLERKLNSAAGDPRFEVLNFGTSNYSTGQCLLAWDEYASKFSPDEVFIFLAGFHMNRTHTRHENGFVPPQAEERELWLRPTFRLDSGVLVREPAGDYADYVRFQEEQIASEFGGGRILRRPHGFFLHQHLRRIRHYVKTAGWKLMDVQRKITGVVPETAAKEEKPGYFDVTAATFELNKAILEELNAKIRAAGGRLTVVDASDYFKNARLFDGDRIRPLSAALSEFCAKAGIGRIPLSDDLRKAVEGGIDPRWEFDGHFNVIGNEIFAESMFQWLSGNGSREKQPGV